MSIFYVFFGAGIGGVLRHLLSTPLNKLQPTLPVGTLAVNIIGCFVAGIALSFIINHDSSKNFSLFFVTGLLGGFTTFSAFSAETFLLLQNGNSLHAALNILFSIGSITFAYIGYFIARCF